jgi:hypothetical protein
VAKVREEGKRIGEKEEETVSVPFPLFFLFSSYLSFYFKNRKGKLT